MPRQVAASHTMVMTAPATYGWSCSNAAAAVPESRVAANPSVKGKWHGQISKAPITHARPLISAFSGVTLTVQLAPSRAALDLPFRNVIGLHMFASHFLFC